VNQPGFAGALAIFDRTARDSPLAIALEHDEIIRLTAWSVVFGPPAMSRPRLLPVLHPRGAASCGLQFFVYRMVPSLPEAVRPLSLAFHRRIGGTSLPSAQIIKSDVTFPTECRRERSVITLKRAQERPRSSAQRENRGKSSEKRPAASERGRKVAQRPQIPAPFSVWATSRLTHARSLLRRCRPQHVPARHFV